MIDTLVKITKDMLKQYNKFVENSRTLIQKVIYFSLNKEERDIYYIPYLYGPYSEDVQIILLNPEYKYKNNEIESEIAIKSKKGNIKKTLEFLDRENFTSIKDIAKLSKVHYILIQKNIREEKEIKKWGKLLGWSEIHNIDSNELKLLIEKSRGIEEYVHNQRGYPGGNFTYKRSYL